MYILLGWCEFWRFLYDVVEDSARLGCGVASRLFEGTCRRHIEKYKTRLEDEDNLFLEEMWAA